MLLKLKGKKLDKRYKIIDRIGGGGMANVYKAKDSFLNRFVAIKMLNESLSSDKEFIDRFSREAQAAASLSNPNVVSVYDVGRDGHCYYIVMELVEGPTLKEYLLEKAPLDLQQFADITGQICEALQHAHENGIVHRDIKPHNILLGFSGRVKVADFGIARAASSATITQTGSIMGSVHYFSPEQARGREIGEYSDIYSLGVIMYEMVTGRLPFTGESAISIALKHLQDKPVSVREFNSEVPEKLAMIIEKTLHKEPAQRYGTSVELLDAIKSVVTLKASSVVGWSNFKTTEREFPAGQDRITLPPNSSRGGGGEAADLSLSFQRVDSSVTDIRIMSDVADRFKDLKMVPGSEQQTVMQRTLAWMESKQVRWWQKLLFVLFSCLVVMSLFFIIFNLVWPFLANHKDSDKIKMERFSTVEQARQWLHDQKFNDEAPEIVRTTDDMHTGNEVVRQDPPGGSEVSRDTKLKLFVGNGELVAPDYRGWYQNKLEDRGMTEANRAGYSLKIIFGNEGEATGVGNYQMYKQQPAAGNPINRGDVIRVYIKAPHLQFGQTKPMGNR